MAQAAPVSEFLHALTTIKELMEVGSSFQIQFGSTNPQAGIAQMETVNRIDLTQTRTLVCLYSVLGEEPERNKGE